MRTQGPFTTHESKLLSVPTVLTRKHCKLERQAGEEEVQASEDSAGPNRAVGRQRKRWCISPGMETGPKAPTTSHHSRESDSCIRRLGRRFRGAAEMLSRMPCLSSQNESALATKVWPCPNNLLTCSSRRHRRFLGNDHIQGFSFHAVHSSRT